MWERIKQILIKEFIQIFRDPRVRSMVFAMPVLQVIVFGYAVTTDVKNVSTAIYDQDNTIQSREVVDRMIRSGYFKIGEHITRENQLRELLDHGRVQALVRINKGFGQTLSSGETAPLQLIVDGTDSNTAAIVLTTAVKLCPNMPGKSWPTDIPVCWAEIRFPARWNLRREPGSMRIWRAGIFMCPG